MVPDDFPSLWLAVFFLLLAVTGLALFRLWDRVPRPLTAALLVLWLVLDGLAIWAVLALLDYRSFA